jgi:hypothetical protein
MALSKKRVHIVLNTISTKYQTELITGVVGQIRHEKIYYEVWLREIFLLELCMYSYLRH